jgi:hypothetical protein
VTLLELTMQTTKHPGPAPASGLDHRSNDRFGIALPITMEGGDGETHDISETGLFFETGFEPPLGATIGIVLEFSLDGHDGRTRCEAEVVRVERVGTRVNVAVRLLSPLVSEQ